jgi:hypothetical protein
MKYVEPRPFADGRIDIELINWPFLYELRGSPAEYKAGLDLAIERGWLWLHESGTYVKFTQAARSCSHDDTLNHCVSVSMVRSSGVRICHRSCHPAPARVFFSCSISSARALAERGERIPIKKRSFAI